MSCYNKRTRFKLEIALCKDAEEVYKIVGQLMIKADKDKITKELQDKKELIDQKIKEIEKQEEKLREEMLPLQDEVMKSFKNEK